MDGRSRVVRADVTVRIEEPVEDPNDRAAVGLVNPTGRHPLMAIVPGVSNVLLDVMPVSWGRWLRTRPGILPPGVEAWTARTGVEHADAAAFARSEQKRLPTATEFRAVWGTGRFPWGNEADPSAGVPEPPRFDVVHEVALFPPNKLGFYDLGAWLWNWTDDGSLLGGCAGLVPGGPESRPFGIRCAADLEP